MLCLSTVRGLNQPLCLYKDSLDNFSSLFICTYIEREYYNFDTQVYFHFGISSYFTLPFQISLVVKWLNDYEMGRGLFSPFVAMVTTCEGWRRNRMRTLEITLNQTAFAVRELCPQFIFLQWHYFCAKKNQHVKKKEKRWSKKKKKSIFLLYCICLLKTLLIYLFIFYYFIYLFLYQFAAIFIFSYCLVRLLNPFVFSVWSVLSALGLVCCTGELKTTALVCGFLSV